jgi:hypothetical protein
MMKLRTPEDILEYDKLKAENRRLKQLLAKMRCSPFVVGNFFESDGKTPRKTIMICPMEGSDALYDYVKMEIE